MADVENASGELVVLDRATLCAVVEEARLAPSPLNTQPARWRVRDGVLQLVEDPARRLFASDPSGRDFRISLGAAWEGTRLALSKRGLRLVDEVAAHVSDDGVLVRARVARGAQKDPLADVVEKRTTFRGRFAPVPDDVLRSLARSLHTEGAFLLADRKIIDDAAARIDDATVTALLQPRYLEEQMDWMRAKDHASYARDGVTAETLHLSSMALSSLASRAMFERLAKMGVARRLVSERKQTRSASALVAIHASVDEPDLVTGARFYRAWLRVTAAGLAACPMSVLCDPEPSNQHFAKLAGIGEGRRLAHLWRIGKVEGQAPRAARLPTEELVL
jgi:hypothetical protein